MNRPVRLSARLGSGRAEDLLIRRLEARVLGNAGKHLGPDLFAVMKGENKIRPPIASKCAVRPGLPLDAPPNAKEGSKNTTSLSRGPLGSRRSDGDLYRVGASLAMLQSLR
jgi:hypothetical protein